MAVVLALASLPLGCGGSGKQDTDLDRVLLTERLNQSAALIVREIDAEFVRWEQILAGPEPGGPLPSGATRLVFTSDGVTAARGQRFLYYPAVRRFDTPADARLRSGQHAEFTDRDSQAAIPKYQEAATSTVRGVRATALAGLGRCHWNLNHAAEALAAYADLAEMTDADVAGVPAPLIARRERRAIFVASGDAAAANRELEQLASDVRAQSFLIDQPTFKAMTAPVRPEVFDATAVMRAAALVDLWQQMQRSPAGRTVGGTGAGALAAAWRRDGDTATALVAPAETLLGPALEAAGRLTVSVALESPTGQRLWGTAPRTDASVAVSLADIGLPVALRLAYSGVR